MSSTLYPKSSLGNKQLIFGWQLILIQFFCEESIGEGFKIVTVAVFEKILLFEKNWFVFDRNF